MEGKAGDIRGGERREEEEELIWRSKVRLDEMRRRDMEVEG